MIIKQSNCREEGEEQSTSSGSTIKFIKCNRIGNQNGKRKWFTVEWRREGKGWG